MHSFTRPVLILMLMLMLIPGVSAQETTTAPAVETSGTTTAVASDESVETAEAVTSTETDRSPSSYGLRDRFVQLLQAYPPELGTILALDPTLLSNEGFLAGYPDLAEFVIANPQVRRNPRFYLSGYGPPLRQSDTTVIDEIFEIFAISGTFILIAFALAWLVRTIVEQKRWNKLSRTQSEVHNKILDRFGSSEELLAYIRTPAGSKFLEAAPLPLHAERSSEKSPLSAPLSRIMWSIQLGIVVGAASLGMILVSMRLDREASIALFSMGVIAFCIGAGFIGSAYASLIVSRRLGLWQEQGTERVAGDEDPGLVR